MVEEAHYTPQQLGKMWGWSDDVIRRLFEKEEGVFIINRAETRSKRRRLSMRIPKSVANSVYAKHTTRCRKA
jgi:hypothetical protein